MYTFHWNFQCNIDETALKLRKAHEDYGCFSALKIDCFFYLSAKTYVQGFFSFLKNYGILKWSEGCIPHSASDVTRELDLGAKLVGIERLIFQLQIIRILLR